MCTGTDGGGLGGGGVSEQMGQGVRCHAEP